MKWPGKENNQIQPCGENVKGSVFTEHRNLVEKINPTSPYFEMLKSIWSI